MSFKDEYFYIYIITNKNNTVIYIGVTAHIAQRLNAHFKGYTKGFANRYNLNKLVYYEKFETIQEAIKREKQIKKWNRAWKINLINDFNPNWDNLFYFFQDDK